MKLFDKIQSLPLIRRLNLKWEYRFWLNFSCFALMVLWLLISLFTTKYSEPFIAWHTITGHHYLVLLFGFVFPFFYFWVKKGIRPLWSLVIIAFTIAVNEWLWWIFYYVDHYVINNTNYYLPLGVTNKFLAIQALEHLTIFNYTGMAYIIVIALFLYKIKIHKSAFALWFMMLLGIYGYWLYLGFPITIDFSGLTVLYADTNTNIIEILHWLIPNLMLVFMFGFYFAQNNTLRGLPPIVFRKAFFPGLKSSELIELEKSLVKQ